MKEIICKNGERVIVDDDMYEVLNRYTWRVSKCGYAYTIIDTHWFTPGPKQAFMHHCIVGRSLYNQVTDHINRSKMDNRRENLRNVSVTENARNQKRHLGKTFPNDTSPLVLIDHTNTYRGYPSFTDVVASVSFADRAAGIQKMEEITGP